MPRLSGRLWIVLLLPVLFLGLFAWGLASPIGSSPDDDFHLTNIWCAGHPATPGSSECDTTEQPVSSIVPDTGLIRLVPALVGGFPCYKTGSTDAGCVAQTGTALAPGRANNGSYPGGFYRVMHLFAGGNIGVSVVVMRTLNAVLAVGLIGAALLLTGGGVRRAVALTWLLGLAPLTAFILPSNNPSSWVIMGAGTYWAFLLRFLLDPRGWRGIGAGVLAALTALMAVVARPDGPAFIAVASVACLVIVPTAWRDLIRRQYLLCYAVGVAALAFVLTRTSITNVLHHGVGPEQASSFGGDLLLSNLGHVIVLAWLGLYGISWGLGWGEAKMPLWLGVLGTYLLVAAFVGTWRSQVGRKLVVVLGLLLLVIATPLYVLQRTHAKVGDVSVEPRYMLPLVLLFLAFLFLSIGNRYAWRLPPWAVLIAAVVLAVTNAAAMQLLMAGYAFGSHHSGLGFGGGAWWWSGGSPTLVWVLGTLAMAAAYGALALIAIVAVPDAASTSNVKEIRAD